MNKEEMLVGNLYDPTVDYLNDLLFSCRYPWEILPKIRSYAEQLLKNPPEGMTLFAPGILVGKNVRIADTAVLDGPCVLGDNCEIRPGAFLRGCVLTGPDCVIGNSTELKNCVLLRHVQVPHYNYVGDSVLGNDSHLGAGTICSNLKTDQKPVVIHSDEARETGLRKCGSFVADHVEVGCSCVLNPGTVILRDTNVYPMMMLRGVFPAHSIVKTGMKIVTKEG